MSTEIEIIVVNQKPTPFIKVNGKFLESESIHPTRQMKEGLEELNIALVRNNISHVYAHTKLDNLEKMQAGRSLRDVVIPKIFYFTQNGQNILPPKVHNSVLVETRRVLALITWMHSVHFFKPSGVFLGQATHTCVICGTKTEGYHHGRANISGNEIYSPPPWCSNPDCLSHKLEELTNPKYKMPSKKEAEERKSPENKFTEKKY